MGLQDAYGATGRSCCWIVGAGPSLKGLAPETLLCVQNSPCARLAVNLAGRGDDGQGWLIKPTHFTAYDSTVRFSRSVFLDPTIMKLVKQGRHGDLIPGGTEKVQDCPNVVFFEAEFRKYSNFVYSGASKVNDSLDSYVQAIDLAYLLGFRDLFLLGADLRVSPSPAQLALAEEHGVTYPVIVAEEDGKSARSSDRLEHFLNRFAKAVGKSSREAAAMLEAVEREAQYSFPETKPFTDAVRCDSHYWRTVEYLRLSRRTFTQAGLRLISCTRGSRLNTWFEYMEPAAAAQMAMDRVGDPKHEQTVGKYTEKQDLVLPWHQDIKPHFREDNPKLAAKAREMQKLEVEG